MANYHNIPINWFDMFIIIAHNFALQLVSDGGITRVSTYIGTCFSQNTLEHTKMVCGLSFFSCSRDIREEGQWPAWGRAHGLVWVPLDMIACVGPTTAIVAKKFGQIWTLQLQILLDGGSKLVARIRSWTLERVDTAFRRCAEKPWRIKSKRHWNLKAVC